MKLAIAKKSTAIKGLFLAAVIGITQFFVPNIGHTACTNNNTTDCVIIIRGTDGGIIATRVCLSGAAGSAPAVAIGTGTGTKESSGAPCAANCSLDGYQECVH